jgi:hypothetical protein
MKILQPLLIKVPRWIFVVYVEPSLLGTRPQRFAPVATYKALADYYPQPQLGFVSVGHPAGAGKFVNAFQHRFVRQLVRNEFPTLQSSGSKGCHVHVNGEGKSRC